MPSWDHWEDIEVTTALEEYAEDCYQDDWIGERFSAERHQGFIDYDEC
jgi:hypothetical protein